MEENAAIEACLGGSRWIGDFTVDNSMQTIQALRRAIATFRHYGGTVKAHLVLPDTSSVDIVNTSFQEFKPTTNDALTKAWELGQVTGSYKTKIYQSSYNPTHVSGTESGKEIAITNVTSTTYTVPGTNRTVGASSITLTGLPKSSGTINVADIGDIGTATPQGGKFNASNPLHLLRPRGHAETQINAQFKVVEGGTADGSGNLTIKVIPELIYDATGKNPARNLNRGISPEKDKLRIVPTHQTGVIFLDGAFFCNTPKLGTKSPYDSASVTDPDTGMSLRAYHGAILDKPMSVFVHDLMYGLNMAHEYAARIIFPVQGFDWK